MKKVINLILLYAVREANIRDLKWAPIFRRFLETLRLHNPASNLKK